MPWPQAAPDRRFPMIVALALLCALQLPDTAAPAAGADGLAMIDRVVAHGLSAGGYPGAAVVVGRHDRTLLVRGYGRLGWGAPAPPVDPSITMYDLASLTKALATGIAAMVLYDRGRLDLDARVDHYLPHWRGGGREQVTIRDLLVHRSGLPAGRELWRVAHSPAAARRAVLATPLELLPDTRYVYSDLGSDVLGFVIEAIVHEPLDVYLTRHVYGPLGLRHIGFRPHGRDLRHVAWTDAPRGKVSDRNARVMGGIAGHAGLFASATDVAALAQMMLRGGVYHGVRIVSDTTIARFTTRTAGTRALGWDTCAGGASCGQYMDTCAYGHTGYTGTSVWIDPDHDLFVVVLTNWADGTAVHPTGPSAILADVRADIADLAEAIVASGPTGPIPPPALVALRSDGQRGWFGSSN
jgi:CubicO group peptidase (beta-lactamase class C family)